MFGSKWTIIATVSALSMAVFFPVMLLILSKRKPATKQVALLPAKPTPEPKKLETPAPETQIAEAPAPAPPLPAPAKQAVAVDYDHLLTAVQSQNGRAKSLLLAAGSLNDLPVTIPVNLAVRLAKTHTCLLVDLDMRRNAVARVFDVQTGENDSTFKPGSCATPVKNLWIWPARNFELLRHMNLRTLLDGAAKKYDYVLIYAPYLTTLPDRKQIAGCALQAIAFTGKNNPRLMHLLAQCNCKVMQEI